MNNRDLNSALRVAMFVVFAGMLAAGPAAAQATKGRPGYGYGRPAEKSDGSDIKLHKLLGLGRHGLEKTPEYTTTAPRQIKPLGDWGQILVTYDTVPKWIDELVFQYYVLTLTVEDGKKAYSFFKTTVKYVDIEKGRDHMAAVYLRPSTIKRYGFVVAAAVEVSRDGKVIASRTEADNDVGVLEDKWWAEDSKVMKSPNVTTRDGYLLDRMQTPFSLVNTDDYEVSK